MYQINYGWEDFAFGLLAGILFGALLQRAHVGRFHVIVGQLLFRDWTVAKVMLTGAAVGALGLWSMDSPEIGLIRPQFNALGDLVLGGILFGVGLAVFGYCPGTSLVASMEGRRDALVGVLGMFAGAFAYMLSGRAITHALFDFGTVSSQTLPEVTNTMPIAWIAVLFLLAIAVGVIDYQFGHRDEEVVDGEPIQAA